MVSASDVDRVFLQAVLSRGLLSGDLAKVLWEKSVKAVNGTFLFLTTPLDLDEPNVSCLAALASNDALNINFVNNANNWDEFVARINRTLDKLELEFRLLHDESTGREMYALVHISYITRIRLSIYTRIRSIGRVMKSRRWPQTILQSKSRSSRQSCVTSFRCHIRC